MISMLPKILHIESTDACNAACPQCAREIDQNFNKQQSHHLSVDQLKKLINHTNVGNLEKIYLCGNYGDPAAGKFTLDIYKYFRSINPNITLGMHTNGGVRSLNWWRELALLINQEKDYVIFSIDGLKDTNHIYRINVEWEKIMANAAAFINSGGNAHWEMLVFEHNQHQVSQAQQLAQNMGFKWFRTKISRRFEKTPIKFLSPPKRYNTTAVTLDKKIDCYALKTESLYISALGNVHPCCWLGTHDGIKFDQFSSIQKSWETTSPNEICQSTCGTTSNNTVFENQWQVEIEFK